MILAALRAARFASVCKGSWLSIALGLAMMVLDVQKNLKPTKFYLPNDLCHNYFAQKLSPWASLLVAYSWPSIAQDLA